jgi:hypothetical protein
MKLNDIKDIIFAKHHLSKMTLVRTESGIFSSESMNKDCKKNYAKLFDGWAKAGKNVDLMLKKYNWIIEDAI